MSVRTEIADEINAEVRAANATISQARYVAREIAPLLVGRLRGLSPGVLAEFQARVERVRPAHDGVEAVSTTTTADPGGWMQTRAGLAYFHEDPSTESIRIADIAHALSNICRFGGHTSRFYSVAEHSVLVSRVVPPEHAFVALMHDATEAYVCDVPRPLKKMLGKVYSDLEDKAWGAICLKFGLWPDLPPCVKEADNTVLLAEKAALLLEPPLPWVWAEGLVAADVKIRALRPNQAKDLFLRRFTELMP